jgi:hypothetical protein
MKSVISGVVLAALTLAYGAGVSAADMVPQVQNDIAYISGGVGSDEQQTLRDTRKNYNTYMTFAVKEGGQCQADVDVTVLGRDGKEVATFAKVGPLFNLKLAPGTYTVKASARGTTQTRPLTVAASGTNDVRFYWNAR